MNAERIAKLRELCEKATAGPWVGDRYDGTVKYRMLSEAGETVMTCCDDCGMYEENSEFTMEARTALPELLDEVERMRWMLNNISIAHGHLVLDAKLRWEALNDE
jgi:hypothetical protein